MKKYQIIYADPPWQFRHWSRKQTTAVGEYRNPPYLLMSTEDICKLPIIGMAGTDCGLFLWAVSPRLPDALEVMRHWGFTYKTVAFVWAKQNPSGLGWHFGLGKWTRANAEYCLMGVRGQPKRIGRGIAQLVVSPRGIHSHKPDEVRNRIVQLMGDLPRIELFARRKVEGWDCWGNEVESDIEL